MRLKLKTGGSCKSSCLLFWKEWLQWIFSVLGTLDEILLAFGRLARVHRMSVLPQAKPRRRDGFAIPSSSIPKGGAGCQPAESTKKDICKADALFCGAGEGNRTLVFSLGS